ncbi:hypothetical protein LS71_003930 [Helicobacter jaachi]|uniref:Septum formation initiator n=1 Tax=Helicobacter jaachi TaxID=1677920 RepID=A0A4V6I2M7_9HELI|nr:hypothetical protein [Helicobacter jaachi]TLD96762.1 hypothetical protein LS71_003930 [Helicobacter jaachi]
MADNPLKLDDIILENPIPQSRVSQWEKDLLLESDEAPVGKPHQGLGLRELKIASLILLLVLFLCMPKIYLTSNIYYLSKDIASLQTQYDMLNDENKRLKHDIEQLRYEFLIK